MRVLVFLALLGLLPQSSAAVEDEAPLATSEVEACQQDLWSCVEWMREKFISTRRGLVGFLVTRSLDPETQAVLSPPTWRIVRVGRGTAAWDAGLREGDVIVSVDGQPLPPGSPGEFFQRARIGQEMSMVVERSDREKPFKVVPREPDELSIDAWLLDWVSRHFDEQSVSEFRESLDPRLTGGQPVP